MKVNNNKEALDKMFPEDKILRERDIQNQARDILFDSPAGKVYTLFTFISLPLVFVASWIFFDQSFFMSIIYSFLYGYLFLYFFLYHFVLMRPIKRKINELFDVLIEDSGEKLKSLGILK